ncbi:MAG: hypothetical protein OHK0029_28490 [Armatimonadaceae bacterium]
MDLDNDKQPAQTGTDTTEEASDEHATENGVAEPPVEGADTSEPNLSQGLEEFGKIDWGRDRDIPLSELEGLPPLEQFYQIWATPQRGEILWKAWLRTQPEVAQDMLKAMATDRAATDGISEEEAQTRLAVEKLISDQGTAMFLNYVDSYKTRKFKVSRALKPMNPTRKRKR